MLKQALIAAAVTVAFGAVQVSAATIDFTTGGQVAGADVSVLKGGSLNFTQKFDGTAGDYCQDVGPLLCEYDGFGIGDDEITATRKTELAKVEFTNGPVTVFGIHFFDLFTSDKGSELARFQFFFAGGGQSAKINQRAGNPSDGSGYAYADFGSGYDNVTHILFWGRGEDHNPCANSSCLDDGTNDFAVAGIDIAPVPLPASAFLLMGGLAGLGFMRRHKAVS